MPLIDHPRKGKLTLISLAALLTLLTAMGVGAYQGLSLSAFSIGSNVIVGPGFTGKVEVAPDCIADAARGRVALPYRSRGPNRLTGVLGFVIIPR